MIHHTFRRYYRKTDPLSDRQLGALQCVRNAQNIDQDALYEGEWEALFDRGFLELESGIGGCKIAVVTDRGLAARVGVDECHAPLY
jgi:hypothetical protein